MQSIADSMMLSRKVNRRTFSTSGRVALAGAGADTSVIVTTNALNVRDRHGLADGVIGVEICGAHGLATGNTQQADCYTLYEVNYDDEVSGWSVGDYLQGAGGATGGAAGPSFPVSTRVKVMTDTLNVRDAAGLESNVVGGVTYGAIGETFASVMPADG